MPGELYLVEGNIAAGKTTLVERLCEEYGLISIAEPVAENPYLSRFYAEPKKYALVMQLWLFESRLRMYRTAVEISMRPGCRGVILDRSVFSDYVFALNCYRDGTIDEAGFQKYLEAYATGLKDLPLPTAVLYLDVSPDLCLYRVREVRRRECEQGIPLEYLQGVDACYHEFLVQMKVRGCPVRVLDWSEYGTAEHAYQTMLETATEPVKVPA